MSGKKGNRRGSKLIRPVLGGKAYYLRVGDICTALTPSAAMRDGTSRGTRRVLTGKVVYIHPAGRFVTMEFEGRRGVFGNRYAWRTSCWPDDVARCRGT